MTMRTADDGTIVLEGRCPVEDAETPVRLLSIDPSAVVDWRDCEQAHTAIGRILLVARPTMRGPPLTIQLRNWIEPILAREIRGYIAMVMDLPALQALKELLDGLMRRTAGGVPSTSHAAP